MREKLFEELNHYKTVVSPVRILNNTGLSGCTWSDRY